MTSFRLLEISGLPGAAESRLFRTVDPEVREPAFARNGLDPARLLSFRHGGTKIKVNGLQIAEIFQFEHGTQGSLVLISLHFRSSWASYAVTDQNNLAGTGSGTVSL